MKSVPLVWLVCLCFTIPSNAQSTDSENSKSYTILIKGSTAGRETATEKTADSGDVVSSSDHEIFVTDGLETKRMTFSTRLVLAKGTWLPVSYTYKYTTGNAADYYEVAVSNGRIRRILTRSGNANEINVAAPPNLVIVDFNVYHQYEYLIRRYDFKKGGRQLFADFVPLIGNDIPLAITYLGDEELEFPKGTLSARNFKIEYVDIWMGSLSVDKDGRLLRVLIPAQDLEVVRSDLMPSPEIKTDTQ